MLAWVWFDMTEVLAIRIIFYSRHGQQEILLMASLIIVYALTFLLI